MKKILIALVSLASLSSIAAPIEGTLMLKGSLKTKIVVKSVKSTCRLKVDKVKNILEEDSFGNPGYSAKVEISLDGNDLERNIRVKVDKKVTVTNMHTIGDVRQVKDLDYFHEAEKITVTIDKEGRLMSTSFPFENQTITCNF